MEISCCLCCEDTRLVLEDTPGEDAASSFKCCQGIVHVKTAALFAGISALILSLFSTVCLVLGVYTVNWWLDVILIIINTIVSAIMIWGLYLDSPPLLIPFIVTEIAQCAGFFMLACYVFWFTITIDQDKFRKFDQVIMVVSILVGICIAGSAVWAAAKAYHYIVRKKSRLLLGSSYTLNTISTSLSTATLPSYDYPWAHGHVFPHSPFRPPTPPRIPPSELATPNGYANGSIGYCKGSNGSVKYHAGSNGSIAYSKPNHPIRSTTVTSDRSSTVYRSPSPVRTSVAYRSRSPPVTSPVYRSRSPIDTPSTYRSRSPTVRSSVYRSRLPTMTPSRSNAFPTIPSVMTSSTPSFSTRKRVSFSSDPPDHSLSMTRSLYNSSRNYFLNDYTRPIIRPSSSNPSSLPSSSCSSIARFPRFIDSVRVNESIDRPSRQSLCPSPYSNLHPNSIKHSTQSVHSSHRY